MDLEARAVAINRFNDPSSGCQVLLTTFSCAASGLNLHEACYNIAILEAPLNISTLLQAIGRVHRLGQLHPQKIWILYCEHTFNRYIEWNNTRKFLPQLAGEHAAYLAKKVRETLGEKCDPDARRELIERETEALLMGLLGQARSRLGMGDWMDLGFDHSQNPKKRQLPNADDTGHAEKKQKILEFKKQTGSRLCVLSVNPALLENIVTPESSNAAGPASGPDDNNQRSPQGQAAMALAQAANPKTTVKGNPAPVSSNGRESVAVADKNTKMATKATDLPSRATSVSTEVSSVGMKSTGSSRRSSTAAILFLI
jgi:hypothetical protein